MINQTEFTSEIEKMAANYQDWAEEELEILFEKEWWKVEKGTLSPVRGDSEFWGKFRSKMVAEVMKNRDVVGATLGVITSSVLVELQRLGVDLSDFKIPIAILVAVIARSVWHALEEKNKKSDERAG